VKRDESNTGVFNGRLMTMARGATGAMVAGSLTAAIGAYLFLQIGARLLGADQYASISALWTIQFLVFAVVLLPAELMLIRKISGEEGGDQTGAAFAVGMLAAVGATWYAWVSRDSLFSGDTRFVLLTGVSVVTLSVYAVGRGYLAGREEYRKYGHVTGVQSVARLILGVALIIMTDSAIGGGLAMSLSPLLILGWRPFRSAHDHDRSIEVGTASRFLTGLVIANASAQSLLLGGPLVVSRLGATPESVSVFFVVLSLCRAPTAVANNLLARILPSFARLAREHRLELLGRWSLLLGGVGGVGAVVAGAVAFFVGPAATVLLFGGEYRPSAVVVALLAAGSVLATSAAFANQAVVALDQNSRLSIVWLVALAVSCVVIARAGGSPTLRVAAGFVSGEATALVGVVLLTLFVTLKRPLVSQ
jgi:O-antigen/teichoic acid export membrane protein